MNKIIRFGLIGLTTLGAVACAPKKTETNEVAQQETSAAASTAVSSLVAGKYVVATDTSSVKWTGSKLSSEHFGTIAVSEGSFEVTEGAISAGSFTIDVASIVVKDIPADNEMNAKLAGHLKAADFFDVEKFPTAKFVITSVASKDGAYEVTGDLTLKDSTASLTFPAAIATADGLATVNASFAFDRTKWGLSYGSKSIIGDIADKVINDEIKVELALVAKVEETAHAHAEGEEHDHKH